MTQRVKNPTPYSLVPLLSSTNSPADHSFNIYATPTRPGNLGRRSLGGGSFDLADRRGRDEQRHRDEHGEEGHPDEDARSGTRVVPDHRREVRDQRGAEVQAEHDDGHALLGRDRHAVDEVVAIAHAGPVAEAVEGDAGPERPGLRGKDRRHEHADRARQEPHCEVRKNCARRLFLQVDLVLESHEAAHGDGDPKHEDGEARLGRRDDVRLPHVRADVRRAVDLTCARRSAVDSRAPFRSRAAAIDDRPGARRR